MRVMHLIDSLSAGGAERVAVNMANTLNKAGIPTYLCATRKEGPLKAFIQQKEFYLFLARQHVADIIALAKLIRFIRQNQITILHAHSSSYFLAVLAKMIVPGRIKVVWHDHYGLSDQLVSRNTFFIKIASVLFSAVFSVNKTLHAWALKTLNVRPDRISYVPNYADLSGESLLDWQPDRLEAKSILCLANLRPQKDHHTLLAAFKIVKQMYPSASLYFVGKDEKDAYSLSLKQKVSDWKLESVFFEGAQTKVSIFLNQASIGLLSSISEGLPIALLEYSLAGLPVICTDVGECRAVLKDGEAGWLVPPRNHEKLAEAIMDAFQNPTKSYEYAQTLRRHALDNFSETQTQKQLIALYTELR